MGVVLWQSRGYDAFQKAFVPKSYWANRVTALKGRVEADESTVRNAVIRLKEVEATAELEVARAVNDAPRGTTAEEIENRRKGALAMVHANLEAARREVDRMQQSVEQSRRLLSEAQSNLAKLRGPGAH